MVIFLLILFALQLIWYSIGWYTLIQLQKEEGTSQKHSISLIIAARNEEKNLIENIPQWLNQSHPNFEIIIVDDRSVDRTFDIIEALASKDSRVKRVQVVEYDHSSVFFGKKYALTMGIKQAKNEHMVFTDADCIPVDDQFLERFDYSFSKGNNLVLGMGAFKESKRISSIWMRLDNLKIAMTYFVFAKLNMPYMGVGRALGYTKSLFYSVKGFASHQNLASGDDDLFVQSVSKKAQIGLVPNAVTLSASAQNLKEWLHQKKRHYTTSKKYPTFILILLGTLETFSILGISLIFVPFVEPIFIPLIFSLIAMFSMKLIVSSIVIHKLSKMTSQQTLAWYNLIFEPILSLMNALFSAIMPFAKPQGWKRRI